MVRWSERPTLIARVRRLVRVGPVRLGRDHPDERDVPAHRRHLVMDRKPLLRRQPRYMLEGVVDVIGDRLRRALGPRSP